ncbi:MAG: 4-phosphoerythronate dehydrogenase [Thiotrichales bacterium]|nr:4-phosphoerythronate dehydrogenase [Thiotrichales bacterium]
MPGRDISAAHLQSTQALVIRSRTQVNADLLQNSHLAFIGSTVVGLDHIDQQALSKSGVHFYSAQGCNANSVAEYVIHALLLLAETKGFHLAEKTLGIIGVGQVGKRLQQKAEALGMHCLLNDPPRARLEGDAGFCGLEEALSADIISVHTPLTFQGEDATYHLLNRARIEKLQAEQILVNAARGGIIDEKALKKKPLCAKIVDCWENEPIIDRVLLDQAFLATPHIAGHAFEAKVAGSQMVYQALCEFWQEPMQEDWRKHLPALPEPFEVKESENTQTALLEIMQNFYNLQKDDEILRQDSSQFEAYRRHYPRHHEWPNCRVKETKNQQLNLNLVHLGFQLTPANSEDISSS